MGDFFSIWASQVMNDGSSRGLSQLLYFYALRTSLTYFTAEGHAKTRLGMIYTLYCHSSPYNLGCSLPQVLSLSEPDAISRTMRRRKKGMLDFENSKPAFFRSRPRAMLSRVWHANTPQSHELFCLGVF